MVGKSWSNLALCICGWTYFRNLETTHIYFFFLTTHMFTVGKSWYNLALCVNG